MPKARGRSRPENDTGDIADDEQDKREEDEEADALMHDDDLPDPHIEP